LFILFYFRILIVNTMVLEKTHKLVLHNDSENDFLYVMALLIRYCGHERDQAEQCALITHNAGRCDIKSGNFMDMLELHSNLNGLSLKVELEEYEGSMYKG
jgi:ATP-dependent Clp protease adaptor protein ClpS